MERSGGFSLIDFSSENDSLIPPDDSSSAQTDRQSSETQVEPRSFELTGDLGANEVDNIPLTNGQSEQLPQLLETSKPESLRRTGKCNLRKSLAWDSAFFENPGVLDAEELSSMIEGAEKGKRQLLPRIEEDICRSTESISTVVSENLTLESLEAELFEDIRASVQKASKASNMTNSNRKTVSAETDNPVNCSVKKVDLTSRNRITTNAALKKQTIGIQGSGRMIKQGSRYPQVTQPALQNGNSTSSLSQPPKVISRAETITTKRASMGANRVKAETHDAKVGGKGVQVPKAAGLAGPPRSVPKPVLSSKSSCSASFGATKKEAARSSSSCDGSKSTVSDKIRKSPLTSSARRKIESRPVIQASSCSIPKASSRVPLRKKSSDNTGVSTSLTSKISSSISPASSISEWSSASSSTSTVNQRSKSRASIDTSSSCRSLDSDTLPVLCLDVQYNDHISDGIVNQVTGLPSQDIHRTSMQTGLLSRSALMKPSGLRLPSPKIGFFDGAKSAVRTPSGLGNGVSRAVRNINEKISEALVGMDPTLQSQIDQAMIDLDKTEKKGELGANAILAVSMAACRAGAAEKEVPLYKHIADLSGKTNLVLPIPAFTLISGGKHAGNNLAVQDIMILPVGARRFEEAMQMGSETYHHLKAVITEKYGTPGCNVGEDGGFAPNISSFREGLDLVTEAISRTGYNERIKIAIDVAATDFCIGTKYDLDYKSANKSGQNFKSAEDMIEMYKELCTDYPIVSIEDPFDKEDWEHCKHFSSLGICQVVGDDLLMSNPKRIEKAIRESACNALLLKVNQIGTVTEVVEVVKMAKDAHWRVVISQRSGETNDSFIADLSVGLTSSQIKAGAPCRGERLAKYNQLLRIEEELGDQAIYVGDDWRQS